MAALEEDIPDAPRQPDRLPPLPKGFYPIPDIEQLDETVWVEGFPLLPGGDLHLGDGAIEFHPKAMLGLAWDSNPLQAQAGSDADLQSRLGIGFEFRAQGESPWRADLGGMLRLQRYADTPSRDFTGGDAFARLRHRGQTLTQTASASFERSADPLADIPEQVERQRTQVEGQIGSESRSRRWRLSAGLDTLNYLEDSTYFGEDDRDYLRLSARGQYDVLGGKESFLGAEVAVATAARPEDSPANDYTGAAAQVRWRHAVGVRSSFQVLAGGEFRAFGTETDDLAANDDADLIHPLVTVEGTWGFEERSWVVARLNHRLVEGITVSANAASRTGAEGWTRIRLRDRFDFVGWGWVGYRVDSAPSRGNPTEKVADLFLRGSLEYRLRDGIGIRPWISWQRRESRTSIDYSRALIAVDLFAAF